VKIDGGNIESEVMKTHGEGEEMMKAKKAKRSMALKGRK